MTSRTAIATAATAVLVGLLTACGAPADTAPVEPPAVTAPATSTSAPADVATPEPAPALPTEVGATVPAADVEAVRAAGAAVYVTASGDGIVVAPGQPLPEVVVEEAASTGWGDAPADTLTAYGQALAAQTAVLQRLDDAGVPVIVVRVAGVYEGQNRVASTYGVGIVGVPDSYEINRGLTNGKRATADAQVEDLLTRYPDAQVLDLT